MLYATTRTSDGNYTAQQALTGDRGPDGGFFVPYRQPYFYGSNLKVLREMSFLKAEAQILNQLFGTKITDWDLCFSAGSSPVRMEKIGRRTIAGERWRNTDFSFEGYIAQVCRLLRVKKQAPVSTWAQIAVGSAVLLAMVLQLQREGILLPGESLDVAVSGSGLPAVSCLYLKTWGLPMGHVVCACRESKGLWDLIHDGEMHTDILEPDSQTVDDLENLLLAESYQAEVRRFLNCVKRGKAYIPAESLMRKLREDLAVSIISETRVGETLPGVYATKHYILSREGAAAYAGLLDYRAVTGSGNKGLVLCDRCPAEDLSYAAEKLHTEEAELLRQLSNLT